MISGETILCFSFNDWFSIWRCQHIVSRLAIKNRVFYVNPRCTVVRALIRLLLLKFKMKSRVVQEHGVYVFVPPTYLVRLPRIQVIDHWLKQYRNHLVLRELRRIGFKNPILWLARPDEEETIAYFKPKLVCYHVFDEYTSYMELHPDTVARLEEETARKADLVITVSPSLLERKKVWNKNIYVIPNGSDFKAFSYAISDSGNVPTDLERIEGPIIGYVGAINPKVDLDLIVFLAKAKPEWQLLMIGPVHLRSILDDFYWNLRKVKRLKNVHFLGEKSTDDVVRYFRALDVGIMPYKLNNQVMNSSPIKLFEYLACGKPCVSVDVPSIREYKDIVKIAKSYAEFVDMVEQCLKENSPELEARRGAVARENTWERRVEDISKLLADAMRG